VVLAAIAGVVVWKYVSNADTRAEKNKDLVTVLVAKDKIARGTVFDQAVRDKLFREVKIPADSLPPNRILPAPDQALLAIYKDKVAVTDIFAGTPVVADQFVEASQLVNTVAGAIPKGKEAITVSLDQTHAVGGFLSPGDKVNIIVNLTVKDRTNSSGDGVRTTALLLPGVKVIAVGSTTILPSSATPSDLGGDTTTTQATAQPASLITLEVTPRQAEQIVQATALGTLYLSLDPPGFDPKKFTSPQEIVGTLNLFDQPLARAGLSAGG
jgi:pilus assembly protein CpaB